MQEIPCARCGTYISESNATKGGLIDNMSRECYCSEDCRDLAEDTPQHRELAAAFPDSPKNPSEGKPKPEFQIVDESSASWALGKLAANRSERDRVQAMAAKRVAELDADYNSLLGRFGADLEAWAKEEAFRRRRKSVTLLDGVLAFRTVPARIVTNEAAPEIAMTLGFVKPPSEPAPDVSAFRKHAEKHFAETGEILPGVERTEESVSFSIKFAAESKGETQEGGE